MSVGSPEPETDVEVRAAVIPAGWPVTVNCTTPEKPPDADTVAFTLVDPPTATVAEVGFTLMEKSEED